MILMMINHTRKKNTNCNTKCEYRMYYIFILLNIKENFKYLRISHTRVSLDILIIENTNMKANKMVILRVKNKKLLHYALINILYHNIFIFL